jgi:predicted permease
LHDIRYALRTLRCNPGFTIVAVLSLALGIGANTAIFSLINAVLLRSLPVSDPEQLVLLSDPASAGVAVGIQNGERSLYTFEEFLYLRDNNEVFSGVFAAESSPARLNMRIDGGPVEEARGKLVSGEYFDVLGVRPVIGRTFRKADEKGPGSAPVAVLSYDYWNTRFGLSASVIGKTLQTNGTTLTVIGVAPPAFHGEVVGDSPGLFIPMMMEPQLKPGRFWLRDDPRRAEKVMWLHVGARRKSGVTVAGAQANIDVVFKQYIAQQLGETADPERRREYRDQKIVVRSGARGASTLRDEFSQPLMVLMAIVGLVLLIACANVANLLLARATARQKEIAIRLALGAGRLKLVRQLLTESVLLAIIGGASGMLLASWAARLLVGMASSGPASPVIDFTLDARTLAFTAAVSTLTGLLFGLAPALTSASTGLNSTLKLSADYRPGSISRLSAGKLLVIAQVAISLLLLAGAGLFVRTLRNLKSLPLGYARENLLIIRVDGLAAGYKGQNRGALFRRLLDNLGSIPGVHGVTLSENGLFSGTESGDRVSVEGYHSDKEDDNVSRFDQVGPNYFSTLRIPIILGREIGPQDSEAAPAVCVVNEEFAKFFFGSRNPIGKHVTDEFPDTRMTFEIVGVSGNARDHTLRGEVPRRFYIPVFHPLGDYPPAVNFEIRTHAKPERLLTVVRRRIQETDDALPILGANSLLDLVDRRVAQERLIAQVSGFFGMLALVLAGMGLYGVLAYAIARRSREIGIRMALGAARGLILRSVLQETAVLVVGGVAIGIPAVLAGQSLVQSVLYGVPLLDPLTLALSIAILTIVAALAAYVPARRATLVDPLVALRSE